jgi:hypothetical protein
MSIREIQKEATVKKLFALTKEESNWLSNFKHENKLSSENAAIKILIHDKMKQTSNAIDEFFANKTMCSIMKELSDK